MKNITLYIPRMGGIFFSLRSSSIHFQLIFGEFWEFFQLHIWLPGNGGCYIPRMGGMGLGLSCLLLLHHPLHSDDDQNYHDDADDDIYS